MNQDAIARRVASRILTAARKKKNDAWLERQNEAPDVERAVETFVSDLASSSDDFDILRAAAAAAKDLPGDLGSAASCETQEDFEANVKIAETKLKEIALLLKAAKVEAKTAAKEAKEEDEEYDLKGTLEAINTAIETLKNVQEDMEVLFP